MKKLINIAVSLAMILVILPLSVFVSSADEEYNNQQQNLFTYTFTEPNTEGENGAAIITGFVDNYKELLGDSTEIVIPDVYVNSETGIEYTCSLNATKSKFMQGNDYITKVTLPNAYSSLVTMFFKNAIALKTVVLKSSKTFSFFMNNFSGCTSLEKLYICAEDLSNTPSATVFKDVPASAIAYVKNETVKEKLVNWPGTVIIDPNMNDSGETSIIKTALQEKISEVETFLSDINKTQYNNIDELETALANAKEVYDNASATQDEVNNATIALDDARKNVTEIITTDKTALAEKIIEAETLIASIEDESKWLNVTNLKNEIVIAKGIYDDNTATQTSVDQEVKYLNTAIELCHAIPDKVLLRGWINIADNFMADKVSSDYTNGAEITQKISNAKSMLPNTANVTQAEVDEMCQYLDDLVNHRIELVPADSTSQRTALQTAIAEAELIENNNYTDESWEALQSAIDSAKEIYEIEGGLRSEYTNAKTAIQSAIDALELDPGIIEEPGNPFIKVEKNAKEAVLDTYTADENTAGSVKIKVTFDCASDVSYNPSASIELKAMVGTTESYSKFYGTDETYTNGQKGFEIELPLTSAIAEGDEVELTAYTYAWNEAADYVYGITKVEYVNEVGQILKVITDRTIALDELKADIAEAEAIEQGDYTDESFAVLQTAIGAAKLVADDAEKAVIDEAREALAKAIAGLTTESIIVTGTVSGTIKVSDENAETEMTVTAVSADGTKTSVTATSMGTYALENLEAGEYTLTISGGKYAERSYDITVAEGEIAQDVELNPYGDINGDGLVTTADVGMANSHAKGVQSLEGYKFVCADVKIDGSITTADVGMINSHAKSVSTLW